MENNSNSGNKIRLTGLWKGKDRNGETYYSGSINGGLKLYVFSCKDKKKESDPDAEIFLIQPAKKNDGGQEEANPKTPRKKAPKREDRELCDGMFATPKRSSDYLDIEDDDEEIESARIAERRKKQVARDEYADDYF